MTGENEEIRALKCGQCGGDLVKSYRSEYDDEDEEYIEIPIAKCASCGNEYDQYTQEYYGVYADDFTRDVENTVFKLGKKGVIDGVEYEVIGRIRFQDEEESEKATWDEWVAINTAEGSYHYFVEEEGKVHSYVEYVPESIDLESDPRFIEFDGKQISKDEGYIGRIVFADGELPWQPEIGEAVMMYDFKKDSDKYSIEKSEGEVSITKGTRISYEDIIDAFGEDEDRTLYDRTMAKRKDYKRKSLVYLVAFLVTFALSIVSCGSGSEVQGVMNGRQVLSSNQYRYEQGSASYMSQVLYGPFMIENGNSLYNVRVSIDESVQPLRLGWQSFRLLLINEERLNKLTGGTNNYSSLYNIFNQIDSYQDPVESYVVTGDFWDEEGYDGDGYWHENDLSADTNFVLDQAGRYYVYLELYNNQYRNVDSIKIRIKQTGSVRYYIILMAIFAVLMLYNRNKSRTYNEMSFDMAAE